MKWSKHHDQLATKWRSQGKSKSEIAKLLGVSRSTVGRHYNRAVDSRSREPSRYVKARRVKILALAKRILTRVTPGPTRRITVSVREFPSCQALKFALQRLGINVSASTVRRDLKSSGWNSRVRPMRVRRYVGDEAKRLAFARKCVRRRDLRQFVFTDEKVASLDDRGERTEWVAPGEEASPRGRDHWAPSVFLYGAIGIDYRFLKVLDGVRLDAESYCTLCVRPQVARLRGRVMVFDNAKVHVARFTKQFLRTNALTFLDEWPPRSPDLNPIENMWGIVQRRVHARAPTDTAELKRFWVEEWNRLPVAMVNKLVTSYKGRLISCVAREGKSLGL